MSYFCRQIFFGAIFVSLRLVSCPSVVSDDDEAEKNDLLPQETRGVGGIGGGSYQAGKFAKIGSGGVIKKGSATAGIGAKKFAKIGGAKGGTAGSGGFKKSGAKAAGGAAGAVGKSFGKVGAIKKLFFAGYKKSYAKVAVFSHNQAFKFGSVSGYGASGGKFGAFAKKGAAGAAGGAAARKRGGKFGKFGKGAVGKSKGLLKKGAVSKAGFKKYGSLGSLSKGYYPKYYGHHNSPYGSYG